MEDDDVKMSSDANQKQQQQQQHQEVRKMLGYQIHKVSSSSGSYVAE